MTDACERWMEISDRLMVGDRINVSEREFLRRHEMTCADCGAESSALRALKPLPLHSVPDQTEVDRILRAAQEAPAEVVDDTQLETTLLYLPRQTHTRHLGGPSLVDVPMGDGSNVADPRGSERNGSDLSASKLDTPELGTSELGSAESLSRPRRRWLPFAASAAAAIAALGVMRSWDPAGLWSESAEPRARAVGAPSASSPERAAPSEKATTARAPSEPARTRNQEDTCGEILAGITLCLTRGSEVSAVNLSGSDRTVYLERGRAIASLAPQPAGTSFSIVTKDGKVTAIGTVFSVEVTGEGKSIARVARGKVLVHADANQADHALLAGQMLRLGERESLRLAASDRQHDISLLEQLAPESAGLAAHDARSTRPSGRSAKDELARARELRSRGDFTGAASVYRALHQENPHSAAGRAALLSLGGLLLAQLNDPSGALNAYNSYLSAGQGALTPQAEYGRIRALRSLGRTNEEQAAVATFLKRYPNAPEARALKQTGSKPQRGSAP